MSSSHVPEYRVERWRARGVLWQESTLKRVRTCGRWAVTPDGSVDVRSNGAAVGYAGLASCGSVWACPVCNAKVQGVRRLEVAVAVETVLADGGGAAFGAYTLRHHARSDLDATWRALSKCWQRVAQDRSVRRLRERLGLVGTIRAAEVTHGANGWHPHLHPVHLFGRPVDPVDVAILHAEQYRAWVAAAERLGLSAPSSKAQHLHAVSGDQAHSELSDYFTKAEYAPTASAVGWEMTSTQTKTRTRAKASRTPWQILAAVYEDGDADALDLWHAWERGSHRKRALTWSRGLRSLVGLDVEASDEEIAERVVGDAEDTGFVIEDWTPVRRQPALGGRLLSVIGRNADWAAGRAFCAEHEISIRDRSTTTATPPRPQPILRSGT